MKSGNGRGRGMGEQAAREMEIVETFSRRQEGRRRVKHKFREKKPRSDSKLWNGLTPSP